MSSLKGKECSEKNKDIGKEESNITSKESPVSPARKLEEVSAIPSITILEEDLKKRQGIYHSYISITCDHFDAIISFYHTLNCNQGAGDVTFKKKLCYTSGQKTFLFENMNSDVCSYFCNVSR